MHTPPCVNLRAREECIKAASSFYKGSERSTSLLAFFISGRSLPLTLRAKREIFTVAGVSQSSPATRVLTQEQDPLVISPTANDPFPKFF